MSAIDLTGKAIVVTGAGRGLGRAMSLGLLRAGASVTMVERDADPLKKALEEARALDETRVHGMTADVTDENAAANVMAETITAFGKLSCLINNAAVGPHFFYRTNTKPRPPIWEADLDLWRETVNVNANGPFIMTMAALPHFFSAGWGRIVNVTTSLETMINPGMGPYGPAKACAEAFTHSLAADLEGSRVTANVLIPGGPAATRMIPADGRQADRSVLIQPEIMIPPAIWLCSEDSDGTNGQRFRAIAFDADIPPEEAAKAAGAPAAWPQLKGQAVRPPGAWEDRKNPGS